MSIELGLPRALRRTATRYLPSWVTRVPAHLWALWAALVVGLVLRLWPIGGFSSEYDEGVYWQSLRSMAHGQPLYTAIFSSQPPAFLAGLYPFYLLFGQTLTAARLAIVVYSLVGIVALYVAAREIGGRWCGVLAAVLLAVEPLYAVESRTLQAEAPSLAWQLVCIALAVVAARRLGRTRQVLAVASGAALGLGVMTKLWDVVAAPPALLYLSGYLERPHTATTPTSHTRAAVASIALFCAGFAGACILVLLPFAGRLDLVYDQAVRFHTAAALAASRGLGYNVRFLAHSGELYPLLALGALSVALAIVHRSPLVVAPLLWLVGSLLVLLQQQPLFDHHRVLLSPPLALLGALVLLLAGAPLTGVAPSTSARVLGVGARRAVAVVLAVVVLVCLGVSARAARAASSGPTALQVQAASALQRFTIPSDVVASDDQYVAGLADRDVLPQLVDTSLVRIESGYLTTAQVEALITQNDTRAVLFASGRFDMLPGFRAWVEAHFTRVADLPAGGALFLKVPQGPQIT